MYSKRTNSWVSVQFSSWITYFLLFVLLATKEPRNWLCEFCKSYNRDVDVTGWTKPTEDDVTYELQPPKIADSKETKLEETHNVIFVIDVSGSMTSSEAVSKFFLCKLVKVQW